MESPRPLCLIFSADETPVPVDVLCRTLFVGETVDLVDEDNSEAVWSVSNKYYTASINLVVVDGASSVLGAVEKRPGSSVQAAVVYFKKPKPEALNLIDAFFDNVEEISSDLDTKLVVVDSIEDEQQRSGIVEKCIDKGATRQRLLLSDHILTKVEFVFQGLN
jgi:hypothetical protein